MKQRLTLWAILLTAMLAPPNMLAQNYDFTAVAPSGQTLYYKISGSEVSVVNPSSGNGWDGYVSGDLTVPDSVTYNGITYPVTTIGNNAFCACPNLTSLIIPNTVTSIEAYAINNCSRLISVTLPNGLISIGFAAIAYCYSLHVTIPDGVSSIESFAFQQTRHIEYHGSATGSPWGAISMNGVIDGDFVFSNENKDTLTAYLGHDSIVTVPNTVTVIGSLAFSNCTDLYSVTLPNSLTTIGEMAFTWCWNLADVHIPNTVTLIGNNAFREVRHIEYHGTATGQPWGAYSMNGVTDGDFVFSNENRDTLWAYIGSDSSVSIPNTVTAIGNNAFNYYFKLTSVTLPNGLTSIGENAFPYCYRLKSIALPDGLTTIGKQAFASCDRLAFITIPDGVTLIGERTFASCFSMASVTIGSGVTYIDGEAFSGCTALTEIHARGAVAPQLANTAFTGVPSSADVTIPCGSSMSYYSRWSYFSNFIEEEGYAFSAASDNEAEGTVEVLTQPTCQAPTAVVYAAADSGYIFSRWNDNNTDNPRVLTLTSDTSLLAYFSLMVYDTAFIHDTAYIDIHDTTYLHDTAYVNIYLHDTAFVNVYVHDTMIQYVHQYIHDTAFVNNYIHDTLMLYVNQYIHDTAFINNYIHDTVIQYVNQYVHDTTHVHHYVHDTVFLTSNVYDTTGVANLLGAYIDSLMHDSGYLGEYILDSLLHYIDAHIPDTLTVYTTIHDTVVAELQYANLTVMSSNTEKGVCAGNGSFPVGTSVEIAAVPLEGFRFMEWSDGSTLNPRVVTVGEGNTYFFATFTASTQGIDNAAMARWNAYADRGAVVVQGEGLTDVEIYDEYGRRLYTGVSADYGIRFEVPASGVYFVRVAGSAARRVVVIR